MNLLSLLCLVSILFNVVLSQMIIKSLPGFPGNLPFKLETGYIGVGELEEVQLFYYFVESERNPRDDPLVLWLAGGPGCSGFSSLVYEIGPLNFDYANSSEKPTFALNPYSWTKIANIIFLDAPVGTGFSYATNLKAYGIGDKLSARQTYEFLRKWLTEHPVFQKNQLYIGGDSYSGILVPIIVQKISDGIDKGLEPKMNLQGYVLGNPLTDQNHLFNARVPFAYRAALVSDEIYESAKRSCNGEYVNVDPSNSLCIKDLQLVTQCIERVYLSHILEPTCNFLRPKPSVLKWDPSFFQDHHLADFILSPTQDSGPWCRSYNYVFSYLWANDETVREALHVRQGTVKEWSRCYEGLPYTNDVPNVVSYHRNLLKKGYRVLIYSGDHDLSIPYVDTKTWIQTLNLTIIDDWKPWFTDGQVAGYSMTYSYKSYHMTFSTVKGGGHTAPEYKPKECFAMVYRWFANYPL